jgi:hypothetical protein
MSIADEFLLFDGAQLQDVDALSAVLALPDLRALYADLGEEAQGIGPFLVPSTEAGDALCTTLDAMDGVFATTRITCPGGMPRLATHLHTLRYLNTLGERRYFLRYADNRSSVGLWQVMDAQQRRQLLGPATQWVVRDATGKASTLQRTSEHNAAGPIILRPEQFGRLLEQSRPGGLMSATMTVWTGDLPSYAARMASSERVYAWLQESVESRTPLAPLVNAAMWRSNGQALDDARFQDALHADEAAGRPASILEWEPSTS